MPCKWDTPVRPFVLPFSWHRGGAGAGGVGGLLELGIKLFHADSQRTDDLFGGLRFVQFKDTGRGSQAPFFQLVFWADSWPFTTGWSSKPKNGFIT